MLSQIIEISNFLMLPTVYAEFLWVNEEESRLYFPDICDSFWNWKSSLMVREHKKKDYIIDMEEKYWEDLKRLGGSLLFFPSFFLDFL